MSLIAFINKKNFEISDELKNYIYCDYEISYVIATLNKKGYKTNYSCAGHNESGLMLPIYKCPIEKFQDYLNNSKKDKTLHFIKKDDKYFYHKDEKTETHIYISFAKNYNFKILPKGFKYELVNNNSYISKKINYYKDKYHSMKKSDEEIFNELKNAQDSLKLWVDKLN